MDYFSRAPAAVFLLAALSACASGPDLPSPRSIIVYSGERVQADPQRMADVEDWLLPTLERIDMDPAFLIQIEQNEEPTYPWETLEIEGDTASLGLVGVAADAETPYLIYGFLRLMSAWDTLGTVLPEAQGTSGYDTERAIVSQVADVWLLGRSVFDTQPYGPLDELVYAKQFGYLDEFIFATQGERFPDVVTAHRETNPGSQEDFRGWFRQTFESDGPRYVLEEEGEEEADQALGRLRPEPYASFVGEAQIPGA